MNKIVLGGILVTMMGGVPGATYLLTQEKKTTTTEPTNPSAKENGQNGVTTNSQEIPCTPSGGGNTCPDRTQDPQQ